MHTGSSLMLVVACTVVGIGLAALGASLTLDITDRAGVIQQRSPSRIYGQLTVASGATLVEEPLMTRQRHKALIAEAPPSVSTTKTAKSPLYPQNGVTLWDRIRVSSQRDRQAFLFGAAIQIHAPETAATPGPRFDPAP